MKNSKAVVILMPEQCKLIMIKQMKLLLIMGRNKDGLYLLYRIFRLNTDICRRNYLHILQGSLILLRQRLLV